MKVYFDVPEIKKETTVAIGTFDGVHLGHKIVLQKAREIAEKNNQEFVVFTFLDHPAIITGSKKVPLLLTTSEEKIARLEHLKIDYCVIPHFTKELMQLSPEEFLSEMLLKKLNARNICVGFNFFFGHRAAGNGETLRQLSGKYGYRAEIIEPVMFENTPVSSSVIRDRLAEGDIATANKMLGYSYYLKGVVIKGKGIGKSVLGIPTANVGVDNRKLLPRNGVYTCEITIGGKKHTGVVNIGNRPTFDNGEKSIEVHILEFDQDIYDEIVELNFTGFLREEQKFSGIEALKEQILKDIGTCNQLFNAKIK